MACSRDCRKFGLAALAGSVTFVLLEALVHSQALLGQIYMRPHYATLWNPPADMQGRLWAMLAGQVLAVLAFTKLYAGGYEEGKPPLGQGARFGAAAGFFVGSYHALMSYFVYPVSCRLAAAWFGALVLEFVIVGAVVASIYKFQPHTHPEGSH